MLARKATQVITLAAGIAAALTGGSALADQGSGKSAGVRNDNAVVICHYDRNQTGKNAGPHTITINASALDSHLANHVKKDGFEGDDFVGPCWDTPPKDDPPAETPL